ncbi:unnamed protein product [Peniophora sp. CBMAI 1063]|nr:unnamed protein product [Peniophora sp. CBMAI 1063]
MRVFDLQLISIQRTQSQDVPTVKIAHSNYRVLGLPDEVASTIFDYTWLDNPDRVHTLLDAKLVCRDWCRLIKGTPILWARVHGDLKGGDPHEDILSLTTHYGLCTSTDLQVPHDVMLELVRQSRSFYVMDHLWKWWKELNEAAEPWVNLRLLHFHGYIEPGEPGVDDRIAVLDSAKFPNLASLTWEGKLEHRLLGLTSLTVTFHHPDHARHCADNLPPRLEVLIITLTTFLDGVCFQDILQPLSHRGLLELSVMSNDGASRDAVARFKPIIMDNLVKVDTQSLLRFEPGPGGALNRNEDHFPSLQTLNCHSVLDAHALRLSRLVNFPTLPRATFTYGLTNLDPEGTSWPFQSVVHRPSLIQANDDVWKSFCHSVISGRDTLVITAREVPFLQEPSITLSVVDEQDLPLDGYLGVERVRGRHLHVALCSTAMCAASDASDVSRTSAVHSMSLVSSHSIKKVYLRLVRLVEKPSDSDWDSGDSWHSKIPFDPTAVDDKRNVEQLCNDLRWMLNVNYFMADLGHKNQEEIGFLKALLKNNTDERDTPGQVTMSKLACIAVRVTALRLAGKFWKDLLSLARVRSKLAVAGRCVHMRVAIFSRLGSSIQGATFEDSKYLEELASEVGVTMHDV